MLAPKQTSCYIGKTIIGMDIDDIDGDGEKEYIFTDGMDIFIYHKSAYSFKCIWSTHLSIESFEKYIYTADTNLDGVKELYMLDSTGTTSKYVLEEKGIYIDNESISYGERYNFADFNGDGRDDCLIITDADVNTRELRIIGN